MELGQNFTPRTGRIARPTISTKIRGSYSSDPCSPRQTIEQPLHGQRFDRAVVYMTDLTYKHGQDHRLESSSEMDRHYRCFCDQSRD